MQTLLLDLRYGLRMLVKSPVFTVVAVFTLALGIGAGAAIFSVVKAVLLRPLPFPNPDQLVQIRFLNRKSGEQRDQVAYRDVVDWREQNRSFVSMGVYGFALLDLTGGDMPDALYGARVSSELIPTLGAQPALGRSFLPSEDRPGNDHVVILSYELWRGRFRADRSILGKTIRLTGPRSQDYLVVGVMPSGFNFPLNLPTAVNLPTRRMAFWIPFGLDAAKESRDDGTWCTVVARLRPGVSLPQAQADLDSVAARLARDYPQTNADRGIRLVSLSDQVTSDVRPALLLMLGAIALVILIVCVNITNLLLAQAMDRRPEVGIRIALGANRYRLARQWITEGLLLAIGGGGMGLILAAASLNSLLKLAPQNVPRLADTRIDIAVLIFTFGLSIAVGQLFGVIPCWHSAGTDPLEALKEGGTRSTMGRVRTRTRDLLIVAEVALSVVLTIGACLLIRSFVRLLSVDPGFRADHLLTAIVVLPDSLYPELQSKVTFYGKLIGQVQALPGVESAGAVNGVPLSGNIAGGPVTVEGRHALSVGADRPEAEVFSVSTDYLPTMGISLLEGRELTRQDAASDQKAAIINDVAAKRFWPNESPLGKRLSVNIEGGHEVWRQVLGIVKSTRDDALDQPAMPAVYVPMEQGLEPPQFLVARTTLPATSLAAAVRQAVAAVDKDQPVFVINSMQDLLDDSVAQRRFTMLMVAALGTLALILAAVGIYGVISYSVSRRTHEIGVRVALGAQRADVLKLVVREGLTLALTGVGVGLAGALVLTRFLSSVLYGVLPTDLVTFAGVSLLLTGAALLASYIPARRATKVDPIEALRYE